MRTVTARDRVPGIDDAGREAVEPAELTYNPADPFVVKLSFLRPDVSQRASWEFSRSLLAEGLEGHAGYGDVRAWPGLGYLHLRLSSPDGVLTLDLRRQWVETFLSRSYRLVPPGSEVMDVDYALARLREDA